MLLGLAIAFSLAGTFFCLNFGARKLSSVLVGNSGLSISLLIAMSAMWFVSTLSLLTGELQIVLAMSLLYISLIKAELWSQLWGHVRRTWFWLALLLAWSIALAVNAKITDGAAALALVVTVVTLLIVLQTELAFVASVFGNLLNQSKQKTAMLLALLMFVLGLVVVNPHSVFFASLLLFLTVLSYSIWQPPQTPYNNKIRVAVMLTLYLALKLVAFDKSVMSTLMYFAWISFVATVGSNGAIVLFSLLNHQRMIRR
jgi:hypothetical protein